MITMAVVVQAKTYKYLYHSSPLANRDAILQQGLIPGKEWAFGTGEVVPSGVYLSLFSIDEYGSSWPGHDGPYFGYDRWRVNIEGLDVQPDPTQPNTSFIVKERIPPSRLKLLKRGDPDWEKHI